MKIIIDMSDKRNRPRLDLDEFFNDNNIIFGREKVTYTCLRSSGDYEKLTKDIISNYAYLVYYSKKNKQWEKIEVQDRFLEVDIDSCVPEELILLHVEVDKILIENFNKTECTLRHVDMVKRTLTTSKKQMAGSF